MSVIQTSESWLLNRLGFSCKKKTMAVGNHEKLANPKFQRQSQPSSRRASRRFRRISRRTTSYKTTQARKTLNTSIKNLICFFFLSHGLNVAFRCYCLS